MLTGPGVNATDAGEVWHLLDQRMNIPATHIETAMFNRVNISKYNTIIMVGGSYADLNKEKLKAWVQAGGNLVLIEEAVSWAAESGISSISFKKAKPTCTLCGKRRNFGSTANERSHFCCRGRPHPSACLRL
jgi:hypothetical protein